jgi:hypothetical protein
MERKKVAAIVLVSQQKLYKSGLDSKEHSNFTGSVAKIDAKIGGRISS